jgi:hypothetical protein
MANSGINYLWYSLVSLVYLSQAQTQEACRALERIRTSGTISLVTQMEFNLKIQGSHWAHAAWLR